ncbi:hypothetical protein GGI21_003938, partial [Coemansia aciculifera]
DIIISSEDDSLGATRVSSVSPYTSGSALPRADNDESDCSSASGIFEVPVEKAKSSRRIAKGAAPKSAKSRPKVKRYFPLDDEEIEHEGLEVIDENRPDEPSAETTDDLPCRTLDNFVVFDEADSNRFGELEDIGMEYVDITISGDVKPIRAAEQNLYYDYDEAGYDDDDEDEDDTNGESCSARNVPRGSTANSDSEGSVVAGKQKAHARPVCARSEFAQRIKLSAILNYETHLTKSGETEIWVRTCFAWYKLLNPDPAYASTYSTLYKTVYIAHQALLRCKTTSNLSVTQLIKDLRENPSDTISKFTPITDAEFRKYRDMIIDEIKIFVEASEQEELLNTPLIRAIYGKSSRGKAQLAPSSAVARGARTGTKAVVGGKPKNENPACITPLVASIAQGLYASHLLNVSHFESKYASAPSGDEGSSDANAWRKRYTEETKAKTKSKAVDKVKGRVAMSDLEAHISLDKFRVGHVNLSEHARLPPTDDDMDYYSEVSVVPTAGAGTAPGTIDEITIKVGDVVLVRAPPPTNGATLDSLWERQNSGGFDSNESQSDSATSAKLHVCAVQVVSIMCSVSANVPTFHGRMLLPGRDTLLQEVAAAN